MPGAFRGSPDFPHEGSSGGKLGHTVQWQKLTHRVGGLGSAQPGGLTEHNLGLRAGAHSGLGAPDGRRWRKGCRLNLFLTAWP